MKAITKGIILAIVHVAIVSSLGVKLLVDRARYPRVWAATVAYDPDLPIRGRYLAVRLKVQASDLFSYAPSEGQNWYLNNERSNVQLVVQNGELTAVPSDRSTGVDVVRWRQAGDMVTVLQEPVAFFIPEHATNPALVKPGEQLWVEVTVPPKGPPRPIRLGVMKDGVFTPRIVE